MIEPLSPSVELDLSLLAGFGFECRPDCGLCCYAEPRVLAAERSRLLQIVPAVRFVGEGPNRFIAGQGEGGACELLSANRCRAHAARPHPCREFPLTAHVGSRLQATVVLSCPGVDLSVLLRSSDNVSSLGRPGFPTELAALQERIDRTTQRRLEESRRRRRKVAGALRDAGRWEEEDDARCTLERALPMPSDDQFPVEDPPAREDGLDQLPLFFDARAAPVALARGLGGWELLELRPEGGVAGSLGVFPPPDRAPALEGDAARLVEGYLDYWLRRDALFGTVHLEMLRSPDAGTVTEWVSAELERIGALVLSRAEVRAKLRRGTVDRLTAADVVDGIRATDQDLLDRESWGDRF
jgi:Fe-S-cluster containining protein